MIRAALLAITLGIAAGLVAQEQIELRDGIIVDDARNVAYVMSVDGGIAAVDLKTGETRWKSNAAAKPLAVIDGVLLSQVEPRTPESMQHLDVAVLDVEAKGAHKTTGHNPLPEGVRASTGQTPEGTFVASAQPAGGGAVVTWEFDRAADRRESRSRKLLDASENAVQHREGVLHMNIRTGSMERLPDLPRDVVEKDRGRWLLFSQAEDRSKPSKRFFQSADGRHVLQSEVLADGTGWDRYQWTIRERETGKQIGQIRSHISFTPFVVRESTITFSTTPFRRKGSPAEPAKLRAVSLESGKELWSVAVRETVWRGTLPP